MNGSGCQDAGQGEDSQSLNHLEYVEEQMRVLQHSYVHVLGQGREHGFRVTLLERVLGLVVEQKD